MPTPLDLAIRQGSTFTQFLRWETEPFLTAAISAIEPLASVRIQTQAPHGIPNGWRVAVVGSGVSQLDAKKNPPVDKDMRRATVIDADTIEFNGLSAVDFDAYASGGFLMWYTPQDLAGYIARMKVKDKVGGTEYLELTTGSGGGIELDNTGKAIVLTLSATVTEQIASWKKAVYDLELESPTGIVTALFEGAITVSPEITTP
jgi:hypothetical protein